MIKVCIQQDSFDFASCLAETFSMRMVNVIRREGADLQLDERKSTAAGSAEVGEPITTDVFICSKDFERSLGDTAKVIEIARNLKAKKILILDVGLEDQFSVTGELKGRVIRIVVPKNIVLANCSQNYAYHMAVTLALDENHVAVSDPATVQLMALANRVSQTDVTVFINGPTGTGKEVLAKYIHDQSNRKGQAFVAVNCAAIPENMLEAILFGHEKGAFTGASAANKGIFRAADDGTLLLDEISEMPLSLQAKLLRALQEKKVTPLGSQREIQVDVRVLATTNREMMQEVREGKFREDLFYRLNVFPLSTQPLSARPADILPISTILLARHSSLIDNLPFIDEEAQSLLMSYDWPGNVRELENVLQRALVLSSDGRISVSDIMVDGAIHDRLSQTTLPEDTIVKTASA